MLIGNAVTFSQGCVMLFFRSRQATVTMRVGAGLAAPQFTFLSGLGSASGASNR